MILLSNTKIGETSKTKIIIHYAKCDGRALKNLIQVEKYNIIFTTIPHLIGCKQQKKKSKNRIMYFFFPTFLSRTFLLYNILNSNIVLNRTIR